MKKFLVLCFVFLLIPFLFAASIDTKEEYKQGETIIAKISANFVDPLQESSVVFYKDHTRVPFDFDTRKIGSYYFIKVSTEGKSIGNYSIKIQDIKYYSGTKIITGDILSNFTIISEAADFSVDPGFFLGTGSFSLTITNLLDADLSVDINPPNEISSVSSIDLIASETKTIDFTADTLDLDLSTTISLSSGGVSYNIPVYIYGNIPSPKCGDGVINLGEVCDGTNWSDIEGCEDFGFSSGLLECFAFGAHNECTFDTTGCFNESSNDPDCGNNFLETGEQCDGDIFGVIKTCKQFGFDAGKISCVDCNLDTSNCYNYEECEDDNDCDDGFKCNSDDKCEKISNYCKKDSECEDNEFCTDNDRCKDKECEEDDECHTDEECVDYICVPENRDCTKDSECDDTQTCENYKCVEEKECLKNSDCDTGFECKNYTCVDIETEKTCTELGGKVCAQDQTCNGDFDTVNNRICCYSTCGEETPSSSTGKTIGYVLIGILVVGLIFVYFKFKRTKRKDPDLFEIGNSPRVKDNLLR
jgi:hypothetical protein